ncbi:ESPR domain-containing protein, partial [Burkholderia ubonensis]|uniref:ESPR domain-containing protein n=1 Tax=Burkholderia ubonensis TaxID=101571 RepID=UPI0018E0302C
MNKAYKTIWNESIGAWVVVSELDGQRGKASRSVRSGLPMRAEATFMFPVKSIAMAVAMLVGLGVATDHAWAGVFTLCDTSQSMTAVAGTPPGLTSTAGCNNTGVGVSDATTAGGASTAALYVGQAGTNGSAGMVT